MFKKAYLLPGALLFFAASCSDEITVYEDQFTDTITVENDDSILQENVSLASAGAIDIFEAGSTITPAGKFDDNTPAGNYPLTQVAQILPPEFEGSLLTSTHVHVADDFAYVSYNTAGETYLGAVDIIRISNPRNPRLTSRLFYENADINSLVYENGFLYIAGGVDAELSNLATANSFVAKIRVIDGNIDIDSGVEYGFQAGQNATDLVIDGSNILVSSGTNGVLTVYNKDTLEMIQEMPYNDLRSLAKNGSQFALLDAGNGIVILDNTYRPVMQIPIRTELGAASKKSIDYAGDKIVVPEAALGAGVYDAASGALLEYIDIPTNPVLENPSDKTTNAVGLNSEVLLMANGGAGICLSEVGFDGAYNLVGILELDGSMNYLATKDDFIIAASGKLGVQIIKLNRPSPSLKNRCKELPEYDGSSRLVVRTGQTRAYSGAKRLNDINVSGALLLCGSWTVINSLIVNDLGLFELKGQMTVGRNSRRRDVRVGANATLRIEGELNIFGDLILEDGATLEFLDTENLINIFGDVVMGENVTVTGSFVDAKDKF